MPERYEDDRLYCTTCKEQPEFFRELIHWQINVVRPDGQQVDTKDGNVEYECPQCGNVASWGDELASW